MLCKNAVRKFLTAQFTATSAARSRRPQSEKSAADHEVQAV